VKTADVNVELHDNVLSISGSRAADETGQAQLVERPYGSFARTLTVPHGVDSDSIEAGYQDGVLTLRIPKPAEQKPKKITIAGGGTKEIEK
jgi:HSP20 family protein